MVEHSLLKAFHYLQGQYWPQKGVFAIESVLDIAMTDGTLLPLFLAPISL